MNMPRAGRPQLPEPVEAKLTADWIKLQYALRNGDATDDLIWVVDLMNELVDSNPTECLRVIERIATIDKSEFIAASLGAGPVEDVMRLHGRSILPQIEMRAAADENLRRTLGGVWIHTVPEDLRERWSRLVGPGNRSGA